MEWPVGKRFILALAVLALAFSPLGVGAEPAATNATAQITVELTDGSRLIGTTTLMAFPLRSEALGKLSVPLPRIRLIQFSLDHESVTVALDNGDTLKGSLGEVALTLRTVVGEVAVPLQHVTTIGVRGGRLTPAGLILHYSFDKITGGEVADETGKNPPTKLQGGRITTDGKIGNGLRLDDEIAYTTFSDKNLPMGNSPRSLAVWFKTSRQSHHQIPFFYGQHVPASSVFLVIHADSSILAPGNCGGAGETRGTKCVTDGNWHQAVLLYDGERTVKVYVDGELDSTTSRCYATMPTGTAYLSLDLPNHNFVGTLDEFIVFDRALSAEEVRNLYLAQK